MDIPFVEFGEEIRAAYNDGPFLSGSVSSGWMEPSEKRRPIGFRVEPRSSQLTLPGLEAYLGTKD